jgi:apolipoprotein N-acyltransferase
LTAAARKGFEATRPEPPPDSTLLSPQAWREQHAVSRGRAYLRVLELLALASLGALQTLAFVHTAWWPLPWLAVAALVWRVRRASRWGAFARGWFFGVGWLVAGVWWLFISMHRYGGVPAPLAGLAVLLLAAVLSIYLGLACAFVAGGPAAPALGSSHGLGAAPGTALARPVSGEIEAGADLPLSHRGAWVEATVFAALWLLAELARGVLFTGFPWVAMGYSQVDAPLALLAPWLGVYGMGAALAFGAAAGVLAALSRGRLWGPALATLVLVAAGAVSSGPSFSRAAGELRVSLLQANVPQDEKFAADHLPQILSWVGRNLVQAEADLVVAPETAVPLLPFQLDKFAPGYWEQLRSRFSQPGRAALIGVPLGQLESGYTNSALGLVGPSAAASSSAASSAASAPAGAAAPSNPAADVLAADYRYDKRHLVPFGEFVPWGFRWFTRVMGIPLGDFDRGEAVPPSMVVAGQRVAPNICYEDLFGEELARRFADEPEAPTIFANLSNIGWFGKTIAVSQHLNISRMRALEFERPMLRATNTGATAIIDHRGRVQALLPPHQEGVLVGQVQGRVGLTPYARWASFLSLWPLAGAALVVFGAVVVARVRRWLAQ